MGQSSDTLANALHLYLPTLLSTILLTVSDRCTCETGERDGSWDRVFLRQSLPLMKAP